MSTKTNTVRQNSRQALKDLHAAIEALGGFAVSSMDGRHCSRCGRPLTDHASRQLGIGPVCNALTTKLAASARIPANYPMATITSFRIQEMSCGVPDAKTATLIDAVAKSVATLVLENASFAASVDGYDKAGVPEMHAVGSDNRLIIQAVDTILSFQRLDREFKGVLIRLVKELGYVGVAGVMAGHGSTGPSKLSFNKISGLLTLTGSKNKPGIMAIREVCRKVNFTTYPVFACTVGGHDALKLVDVALEYWPMLDEQTGTVETVVKEIKEWIAANPPVVATVAYNNVGSSRLPSQPTTHGAGIVPYVSVRVIDSQSIGVTIQNFNWKSHSCPGMVSKIKADIHPSQRRYKGDTCEWVISKMPNDEAISTVEMFAKQFNLDCVVNS